MRQGIVHEIIHVVIPLNYLFRKLLQRVFVGNITHEVLTLLFIYHADVCSSLLELLNDAPPDALCATLLSNSSFESYPSLFIS